LRIQVVYNDDTPAFLFIEKGASDERSLQEAFAPWGE